MMAPLDRLRLDRGAAHLHTLGPRAVAELLAVVAVKTGDVSAVLDELAQYERLTPAMVRVTGGDRFPARPIHLAERAA